MVTVFVSTDPVRKIQSPIRKVLAQNNINGRKIYSQSQTPVHLGKKLFVDKGYGVMSGHAPALIKWNICPDFAVFV